MHTLKKISNLTLKQSKLIQLNTRCFSLHFQKNAQIKEELKASDYLQQRHIGIKDSHIDEMIKCTDFDSINALMSKLVPEGVFDKDSLNFNGKTIPYPLTESQMLEHMKKLGQKNKVFKSYLGQGFYDTITPPVIQRNLLENPGWYTSYTPYQAEISQGRLENLMNFQTMLVELTGMDVANASLLDEASAAAESVIFCHHLQNGKRKKFFVSQNVFPVTIEVVKTRAKQLGVEVVVGGEFSFDFESQGKDISGVLLQNPNNLGELNDYSDIFQKIKTMKCVPILSVDLLSLCSVKTPKEMGAEIVVGTSQRFGVPLGYGGPHAAFMASIDKYKRKLPGRIIGISKDSKGNLAYRMALQTREQHIKREKATSNICTAQALLANIASSYAIYHGKTGLQQIAKRVNALTSILAFHLSKIGFSIDNFDMNKVESVQFFDSINVANLEANKIRQFLEENEINIRVLNENKIQICLDEATTLEDIHKLITLFQQFKGDSVLLSEQEFIESTNLINSSIDQSLSRQSDYMNQEVFNSYQTETNMMRYLAYLEKKDIGLNRSMIPLGSCTMKLNAASQLMPITWREFNGIHPYVPQNQALGYKQMIDNISEYLKIITKFDGISLQPNSGATGEYSGLLAIKEYQKSIGQGQRNVCIIPSSAHGTNPASAILAGLKIVSVAVNDGMVDLEDLEAKCTQYEDTLSVFMITYPSTYGIYEDTIKQAVDIIHKHGGQVYMDGANMNAQVGYTSPGFIGADVCHLNLHKTFAIPHGGGGPGLGPIGVKQHLVPFLPGHILGEENYGGSKNISIAQSPYSSASIIPITYSYIKQLGEKGLRKSTEMAILNANYLMNKLKDHYNIVYTKDNLCAHEFILDIRPFKKFNIVAKDVAKRLQDYSYHSPTVSFPIPETLMVEPTESEDKEELDRFVEAMIQIRKEIQMIEEGVYTPEDNPLVNSPHTEQDFICEDWNHCYSKQVAAFPLPWVSSRGKYWSPVNRIDEALGDRQFIGKNPDKKRY